MKKTAVQAFLNMLGYHVEDQYLLRKNEIEDETEVEEGAVQNEAPPQFQKKGNPAQDSGQQQPPKENPNSPDNVALLDQLIDDIGGFETFKAVLLAAVEMGKMGQTQQQPTAPVQNKEQKKRNNLIEKIVASEDFGEEDLENIPTRALEIMANSLQSAPKGKVDYSVLASKTSQNNSQPSLPRFLLAEQKTN